METARLHQFCLIFETQSISKSAELCGITKSSMSRSMTILQDELGYKLITTEGRRVQITPDGFEFYSKATEILKRVKELRELQSKNISLKIGCQEIFNFNLFPHILMESKFDELTDVLLLNYLSKELEYAISTGKIDWGFSYSPAPAIGVEHLPIKKFSIGIYSTTEFLRKIKELGKMSFVLPSEGPPLSPYEEKQTKRWANLTRSLEKSFTVNTLSTGIALAQNSRAAIFLPDFIVRLLNLHTVSEFRLHQVEDLKFSSLQRSLFLVKKIGNNETPQIKAICASIRKSLMVP